MHPFLIVSRLQIYRYHTSRPPQKQDAVERDIGLDDVGLYEFKCEK